VPGQHFCVQETVGANYPQINLTAVVSSDGFALRVNKREGLTAVLLPHLQTVCHLHNLVPLVHQMEIDGHLQSYQKICWKTETVLFMCSEEGRQKTADQPFQQNLTG
jgi:hypothetical protein